MGMTNQVTHMEQNRVYVTGHRHPDSDSVAAAIGYAFYKRANGVKAIPCRLCKLSAETKYLLERFGFEQPMLLEDARYKLGEIDLDEPVSIAPDKTLREDQEIIPCAAEFTVVSAPAGIP